MRLRSRHGTSYTGKNVLADAGRFTNSGSLAILAAMRPRFILGQLLESSTSGLFIRKIDIGHWRRGCDGALQPARRGVLLYRLDHHYLN
jgi:hypothetical protein